MKYEDIINLSKVYQIDIETAEKVYRACNGDMDKCSHYLNGKMKKKLKTKKVFKIGDIIKCIDTKQGKLNPECVEFLNTYKTFKVIDVNDKYNIDIGFKLSDSELPYYFIPNRFELLNGSAPVIEIKDDENNNDDAQNKDGIVHDLKNKRDSDKKTSSYFDFIMKGDLWDFDDKNKDYWIE